MAFDASASSSADKIHISDKQVKKQGYIEKRGSGILSGWKKRYIILYNNGSIEYYKDDSKQKLQGTIDVSISNLAAPFQNNLNNVHEAVHSTINKVKHGFDIECSNRTWKFRCKNDKTKQSWIDAIRLCIKQELTKIKPSKNSKFHFCRCPNIYHCCFELHVKYDEWIVVWALIKLSSNNKSNINDEKQSDENNMYTSKDCDTNDKMVYLFDNKENRDKEILDKAIKRWNIPAGFYNIFEYFPFYSKNKEEFNSQCYCMIKFNVSQDKHYVLKCIDSNQRRLFIDAICEKIYYQADDIDKTYKLMTSNNNEFTFKYKPIYYHIKYDNIKYNQQDLHNWFHVPISVDRYNYKFILSIAIERDSSLVIRLSDLFDVTNAMMKYYFQLKEFKGMEFDPDDQTEEEIENLVTKYSENDSAINEKDRLIIAKHGLVTSLATDDLNRSTTPFLSGINCTKQLEITSDENKNNTYTYGSDNNCNMNMLKNKECKCVFDCPIYKKVKNDGQYNEYNYKHLCEKNHFGFDYSNKPECKYKSECNAFKRVSRINENSNNFNCHRFDDLCHLAIYRHPPRIVRNDHIMSGYDKIFDSDEKIDNMNQFVSTKTMYSGPVAYQMIDVNDLIYEVIMNGFEKDLCLNDNDFKNHHYSLLTMVNQKLQSKDHKKHYKNALAAYDKSRVSMLSLLLYTGGDSNYNLCQSQRNGNYEKWKCFDECLYDAISCLHSVEDYSSYFNKNINSDDHDDTSIILHLYSGLNKVQLKNEKKIDLFYFPTYVSTSYNKEISIDFAQNNGMLMQFDSNVILKKQFIFCSLEWISKFTYECEILIARTETTDGKRAATMKVMDYQMNSLSKTKNSKNKKNNKSNINSLQIVKVSRFDSQTNCNEITLLNEVDIASWQGICAMGQQSREDAMTMYNNMDHKKTPSELQEFENGLKLFYNDSTFKEYCNKVKYNNYNLNQMDIIEMQKKSKLMKHLIEKEQFADDYYLVTRSMAKRMYSTIPFVFCVLHHRNV